LKLNNLMYSINTLSYASVYEVFVIDFYLENCFIYIKSNERILLITYYKNISI